MSQLEPPDQVEGRPLPSLPETFRSVRVFPKGLKRILAFAGPGFLISVGYMDPGNWATDLAGGSMYGYSLLWVILISSLMAMLLQTLCVRMGVGMGRDLAQACREYYPRPVALALWVLCELAIIACDLAEVIGAAVALNLLFRIPILWGVLITGLDVLVLLALTKFGFRLLEAVVATLVGTILVCFALNVAEAHPAWGGVLHGLTTFSLPDNRALFVSIGILGATVMPHNLYLHTSIVQTRAYDLNEDGKREAIRYGTWDVNVALTLAFFINAAILVLAAAVFWTGGKAVQELEDAHRLLTPMLGGAAATLFAVALLASGQSSTITGTLAGQIVMEGFLNLKVMPWVRRIVTRILAIVPAILLLQASGDHHTNDLLVLSQVVLSLQLPFAIFPLVAFSASRKKMGNLVNPIWLTGLGYFVGIVIVAANIWMLWGIPMVGPRGVAFVVLLVGLFTVYVKYFYRAKTVDEADDEKQGAATLSLAFNVGSTVVKFIAALLTGSISLLSEAVHSGSDVLSSSIAYFSVRAAAEPPDEEHPYGHGKIESLAGFAEAILLGVTVVYVLWHAWEHLKHPQPLDHVDIGALVMFASAAGAVLIGSYVKGVGERSRSLALISNGQHLMIDCVTSVAVLVALLLGRLTGWNQADPVLALTMAAWMSYSACKLGYRAVQQLIDRRLSDEEVEQVRTIIRLEARVLSFHKLRTRLSGSVRHIDVHIVVPRELSVVESHSIADDLEKEIERQLRPAAVVLHVDPFDPEKANR